MAASITITAPTPGPVDFPLTTTGTIVGLAGALITSACFQIDGNILSPLPCTPALPTGNTTWNLSLPSFAFPVVGDWYTLTFIVWDDQGDCTTSSVTFQRNS